MKERSPASRCEASNAPIVPQRSAGRGVTESGRDRENLTAMWPPAPMEMRAIDAIPDGPGWQYEPKWDGFRCIAHRDGDEVSLTSKAGQPLARYFPEIVAAFGAL